MSAQGHRVVFLYSELAGYFLACAEALGQHPDVASVDIWSQTLLTLNLA